MFDWYWGSAAPITALVAMLVHAIYWRSQIDERKGDIMKAGGLGAFLPVVVVLILSPFKPELTDELRDFPTQSTILGAAYIWYAYGEFAKNFKKPQKNIAVCSHCGKYLVAIAVCSHCKAPIPEERK